MLEPSNFQNEDEDSAQYQEQLQSEPINDEAEPQ